MKNILIATATLVGTLFASTVQADPVLNTRWYFTIKDSNGKIVEMKDAKTSVPVTMPTGSAWDCTRTAAKIDSDTVKAGFICKVKGTQQFTVVMAVCKTTEANSDIIGTIGVGDENGWVQLLAACVTK